MSVIPQFFYKVTLRPPDLKPIFCGRYEGIPATGKDIFPEAIMFLKYIF